MIGMGVEGYKKPEGDPRAEMVRSGAWPETDESAFHNRRGVLDGIHTKLTGAKEGWQSSQSYLKAEHTWFGTSANAANDKVDTHTKAMEKHEQQLTAAKGWCGEAAGLITKVKGAIVETVETAVDVIDDTISKAKDNNTDSKDAVKNIKDTAYEINTSIVQWAADLIAGKDGVDSEPPKHGKDAKEAFEEARDRASKDDEGQDVDGPANSLLGFTGRSGLRDNPAGFNVPRPAKAPAAGPPTDLGTREVGDKPQGFKAPPLAKEPPASPPTDPGARGVGDKPQSFDPPPTVVTPGGGQPPAVGKPPTSNPAAPSPAAQQAPSPSGLSGAGGGGGASGAGGGAPSSPLSSIGSSGASGADQAAGPAQAAAQAAAGRAPTDPLQAFSKGFADSAGTPVHAASSGGAPPLAPSPAVPASDAMTPASTQAPLAQTGAPAPTAPVQGPASGGSMGGMGMGGGMPMGAPPLGPPPTAPPAAPVAPPAAAPPPVAAPPANVAGGAQVAPIPVSAARAERDAAQNAAKRTGAGPLELARRIAAALNAPDMANVEDFNFFWITAVTVDGRILVANNYGMSYIPEQVNLPDQVVMVSADESIPPVERASWATYPIVAVQHWAQHNDTTLRAVIGLEHQFTNADSGVHQEVLAPEDIPAKGRMAGRDRLQVIAPQISGRLAQIGDGDLVKILPPAPVDTNPPEDRRPELWDKVWQPLFSGASNRGQVHLQAFLDYAAHAQEWAVYGAHAAGDGAQQRQAVADFIYWQHLGQLIADAIAE